jgi:hypothetical protein
MPMMNLRIVKLICLFETDVEILATVGDITDWDQ